MRLWDVILQVPLLLEPSVTKVALQISGVNFFPSVKILHTWNGRSPVWLNMCTLNVVYRPNWFPHSLHGKFFFSKMYNTDVQVHGSLWPVCLATGATDKVFDACVWLEMPFQGARIEELLATQLTRPLLLFYLPLFFFGEGSLIDFMS